MGVNMAWFIIYSLVSLVEFRLVISVCEAWLWNSMQNLRRVGKNSSFISSRLWTEVHEIQDGIGDPLWLPRPSRFFSLYLVSFRRYWPFKLPLSWKSSKNAENGWFGAPIFKEEKIPGSLSNVWQVLVEFCWLSSEGSWRRYNKTMMNHGRQA